MTEYSYQGKIYTRPDTEPPRENDLRLLHPVFGLLLEEYLIQANAKLTHVDIRVGETIRTVERQAYLFAKGRDPLLGPTGERYQRTWTLNSRHLSGLAADLVMIRKSSGEAVWEETSWLWLYQVMNPTRWGMKNLAPKEFVHLEHVASDTLISLGITSPSA